MGKKKSKKKCKQCTILIDRPLWKLGFLTAPIDTQATSASPNHKSIQLASELKEQEVEALRAIFDSDFILKSTTPLYTHIFSVSLESFCESGNASTQITLDFDLGKVYPVQGIPQILVQILRGFPDSKRWNDDLEETIWSTDATRRRGYSKSIGGTRTDTVWRTGRNNWNGTKKTDAWVERIETSEEA